MALLDQESAWWCGRFMLDDNRRETVSAYEISAIASAYPPPRRRVTSFGSPMADIEWKPLPEGLWTPPAVFADVGNLCLQAFTHDGVPTWEICRKKGKRGEWDVIAQRYCRFLRGGQSGSALRSGSSIAVAMMSMSDARPHAQSSPLSVAE